MSVALVTGATKGIGRATALALAAAGHDLLLTGRNETELVELAGQIKGVRVVTVAADLATYEGLDAVCMTAIQQFDGYDILINNAGMGAVKPATEVSDEEFDRTIAINLRAPFMLCQHAIKVMRRRGGGQIVNIGSGLSYTGRANWSLYAATKFALRGLTESLRQEVSGEGIKVGLVAPGFTATNFFDDFAEPVDTSKALQPEDVAHAILSMVQQPATSDMKEIQVRNSLSP
ncbi:MAG: SDR family oxidoreductase [Thermoplasmatota archaeon]